MQSVMPMLRTIDNCLSKTARILVAVIIFLQMVFIFLGVIFRYFFNSPLIWVDEITANLLIMVTFFGSYVALKENKLAAVTILPDALSKKGKKIVELIANLAVLFLLIMITYYGVQLCKSPAVSKTVTPVLQWPLLIFYAMLPLSTVMMAVHMIVAIFDSIHGTNEKKNEEGGLVC